jgi:hypothetical protein
MSIIIIITLTELSFIVVTGENQSRERLLPDKNQGSGYLSEGIRKEQK